jgi:metal-responsive CopG/Arc/MetJ family transcriptional regulator
VDATRTEKISVNLTPEALADLDRFASQNRWSRSTAAAILIERGLAEGEAK